MADHGHSRDDAKAIPVAELLAAYKRIRRLEPEPEAQVFADTLHRREPRPGSDRIPAPLLVPAGRGRSTLVPLLLGCAAAAALLAGVLVATHPVSKPARTDGGTHSTALESITGARVFRPDVIKASVSGGGTLEGEHEAGGDADLAGEQVPADEKQRGPAVDGAVPGEDHRPASPGDHAQAGAPATVGQEAQQPLLDPPVAAAAATTTTTTATTTTATTTAAAVLQADPVTDPVLSTILSFYATAPTQPLVAFQMLDPAIREGTAEEFAKSWQGVVEARVQRATPDGPNAMVVQVQLRRSDGTKLITRQRIVVSSGPSPRIMDAQLLSAGPA